MSAPVRPARLEEAERLTQIARQAYAPFVPLIGREPPPMLQDFPADIAAGACWVSGDPAQGFVVARPFRGNWLLENVAVADEARGTGTGRALIAFAEAEGERQRFGKVVLYTHAKMTRNLTLYPRLGYVQAGSRTELGLDRVYFEKLLGEGT